MAHPVTLDLIAPHYMTQSTIYNIKNHLPTRSLMMVKWVYDNHSDFLEDYIMFTEDEEWTSHMTYEIRIQKIKAFQKQKEKKAKELKSMFPDIKQHNNLYNLIIDILKPVIVEENE